MIPNRMVSYIRCLFPCTYVFLIFPTVWLLYVLFISIYIRIPHIPNRMAFICAVHFHIHTYSSYSQPYGFKICCSFPCKYVFLIFATVWILYMLFVPMYIRIPHIPNRMAFIYAVHFHVHTYSSYSKPYSSFCRRRKFAASLRDGGNLRHRNASRRHS